MVWVPASVNSIMRLRDVTGKRVYYTKKGATIVFTLFTYIICGCLAFGLYENTLTYRQTQTEQRKKLLTYICLGYFGLGYVIGKYYRK